MRTFLWATFYGGCMHDLLRGWQYNFIGTVEARPSKKLNYGAHGSISGRAVRSMLNNGKLADDQTELCMKKTFLSADDLFAEFPICQISKIHPLANISPKPKNSHKLKRERDQFCNSHILPELKARICSHGFLSDPGKPGVRSLGPDVRHWLREVLQT